MPGLDCRIPPPAVAAAVAAGMWGLARITPSIEGGGLVNILAAAFGLSGFLIAVAGVIAFQRARTTIHPMHPEKASALVTFGIYRYSRNPMYLGILLALTGWAAYLANGWTLAGPAAFALYINRFQIAPEERALATRFGADFESYRTRVRRWL